MRICVFEFVAVLTLSAMLGASCTIVDNDDDDEGEGEGEGEGEPECPSPTGVVEGAVTIEGAADLIQVAGCSTVAGDLVISAPELTTLAGLESLTSIGGGLVLQGNTALTSVAALENLATLGGGIVVRNNPALVTLEGLDRVFSVGATDVVVGEVKLQARASILIEENATLVHLDALAAVPGTLPGVLFVFNNASLTSVAGLAGITSVEDLSISLNSALTNLDGLENLTEVRGFIEITENALTNVDGLRGLPALHGGLFIVLNARLATLTQWAQRAGRRRSCHRVQQLAREPRGARRLDVGHR